MNLRKELKKFRKARNRDIRKYNVYYILHQELLNGHHLFESKFVSVDNVIGAIAFDAKEADEIVAYLDKKYNK